MFTGIITDIGTIRSHEQRGDLRLVIGCGYAMDSVAIGASIACSGACLTVVDKGDDWFAVDLSAETVARTAPGLWQQGGRLNLERALKVGDELGGHIVTGHVDAVGHLVSAQSEGDSIRLVIRAPQALAAALRVPAECGAAVAGATGRTEVGVGHVSSSSFLALPPLPSCRTGGRLADRQRARPLGSSG